MDNKKRLPLFYLFNQCERGSPVSLLEIKRRFRLSTWRKWIFLIEEDFSDVVRFPFLQGTRRLPVAGDALLHQTPVFGL